MIECPQAVALECRLRMPGRGGTAFHIMAEPRRAVMPFASASLALL